ncbi:hypothetical protein CDL15_Pgr027266 [Punica granatum]|uniref:Uncharacterized protein n=1 Tax=Punica granatum TaxID=22663 RepID=A0A218XMM0_PUNGR|nr:hypothetical protein CDL15_Pgr027266 [Punica granatum]PKI35893.1 hypothetical protein CRG98_043717 [Punica granatum]
MENLVIAGAFWDGENQTMKRAGKKRLSSGRWGRSVAVVKKERKPSLRIQGGGCDVNGRKYRMVMVSVEDGGLVLEEKTGSLVQSSVYPPVLRFLP